MFCPRLDHFVRLESSGKYGKCGHMTHSPTFETIEEMQNSEWLKNIKEQMLQDKWPKECIRCQLTEEMSNSSIRKDMIVRDKILRAIKKDYIMVGGVLDNICNSACQSCNSGLSTKIGSLENKNYFKFNNYNNFFKIPQDKILELDINGGEPTASPNYKKLLKNLPKNLKIVRVNTNGSKVIKEIKNLLEEGTRVIITLSFDGTDLVHDYTRWPIKWIDYKKNVEEYLKLRQEYKNLRLNFWTTLSCLNVGDLDNIVNYSEENKIDHAYGLCVSPTPLDIRYENKLNLEAKQKLSLSNNKLFKSIAKQCGSFKKSNSTELQLFLGNQNRLRNISFENYFKLKLESL